jgi:hypothetical protein
MAYYESDLMKNFQFYTEIAKTNLRSEKSDNPQLILLPKPKNITLFPGSIDFNAKWIIRTNLPSNHHNIFDQLSQEINWHLNSKYTPKIENIGEVEELNVFDLEIKALSEPQRKLLKDQGYILISNPANQNIGIWADSSLGIFYAIQTIYQILNYSPVKEAVFPKVEILDFPDMAIRGISDDISRGQAATIGGVKRFMVELSRFKMNHYYLYIEDVVEFQKHPEIGKGRGAFTKQQIKELIEFGKQYFITLSPVFESLGHMDNIITLPGYQEYAEFPGSDCLNIANPKSYELLDDLYQELADMFESPYFHVGCDESQELGSYNCRELMTQKGKGQVYLEHYQKIYDLAKKYGKKEILIYHDIAFHFPEVLKGVPKDYIFVYWDYSDKKQEYPGLAKIAQAGFRTIVSPSVHDYNRFYPNMTATEKNTQTIIQDGIKNGSIGMIQSSWGDFRNENLREHRLYGFVMAQVMAWNAAEFDINQFWRDFYLHFFQIDCTMLQGVKKILDITRKINENHPAAKNTNFMHLWAHPFAAPKTIRYEKGYLEAIGEIEPILDQILTILPKIPRNALCVQSLYFTLRLGRFFYKKVINANKINMYHTTIANQPWNEEIKNQLIEELAWLSTECELLRDQFQKIWTETCSDANLPPLLQSYINMQQFYEVKKQELLTNCGWQNPNIPSAWIYYCPKKTAGTRIESYFRKTFNTQKPIKAVYLQVIGDTHTEIFCNGTKVSEFFSKRTLSLRMLNQMVHLVELTPYWRSGINCITIHNMNYQNEIGIVNIYGEIIFETGTSEKILSDQSWEATISADEAWIAGNSEMNWYKPIEVGVPPYVNGALSYPIFSERIPSHHTYFLGMGGIATRFIPLWLVKLLPKIAKIAYNRGLIF